MGITRRQAGNFLIKKTQLTSIAQKTMVRKERLKKLAMNLQEQPHKKHS